MTNREFCLAVNEALEYSDADQFASDCYLSEIFQGSEEHTDSYISIDQNIIDDLYNIWDVVHMPTAEMRAKMGMTQREFAERFCISRRTIENWDSGRRECPLYLRLMMAEILGLLTVTREGK